MLRWRTTLVLAAALSGACGGDATTPAPTGWTPLPATPYRTLAEYGLFRGNGASQEPAEGVIPYQVNSPLFSDFTSKHRFLAVPPGRRIGYRADGAWALPEGAILVKTFAYPRDARSPALGERLLETRILVKTRDGFVPHTYVWNAAQTEAVREVAAPPIPVSWVDASGATRTNEYAVPNTNQCLTCHGQRGVTDALGLRTDQWNRARPSGAGNQIDDLVARGLFDGAVPAARAAFPDPRDEGAPVEARARAYLHANCGHCHNPRDTSMASVTGLSLEVTEARPSNLGVCRRPVMAGPGSAGLAYDVVPGHPERSVLLSRMRTTEPSARMPALGTNFNDADGADLVERWIRAMPEDTCAAP